MLTGLMGFDCMVYSGARFSDPFHFILTFLCHPVCPTFFVCFFSSFLWTVSQKLRDLKKLQNELTNDFTWTRSEDQRADLTGDRKADYATDIRQLDGKQAMEYGNKLQAESIDSLDRSLASIDDSQKVPTLPTCFAWAFNFFMASSLVNFVVL